MKKVYEVELAAGTRVFYGYEDFTVNDKVVVNTSRGMEVGVVVGVLDELPGKASEKHMKYIACKVRVSDAQLDMKRQEKEALAKELKKMFAEKREMLLKSVPPALLVVCVSPSRAILHFRLKAV